MKPTYKSATQSGVAADTIPEEQRGTQTGTLTGQSLIRTKPHMVNDLATQTRSGSITRPSVSKEDASLVQALVKSRLVQGWNLQSKEDAKLTASIWKEQLDRHKICPVLYPKLVDLAVDYRSKEIAQGKHPTPLTVELMIACYHQYRLLKLEELERINANIEYYRSLRHRYHQKDISLEAAVKSARFHEGMDEDEFVAKCGDMLTQLEVSKENFMEEAGLSG